MTGVAIDHGCRITHGGGAAVKAPFADMPLTMHEMSSGGGRAFGGPYGFIPFTTAIRLPRHVHLGEPDAAGARQLLAERILVFNGCGLVEIAGALYVAAPGTLVDIAPGVPHSWTACPRGVRLPDGATADGTFLMVYEYEAPTGFFPTAATTPLSNAAAYEKHEGDNEPIKIPVLGPDEVVRRARLAWNETLVAPNV